MNAAMLTVRDYWEAVHSSECQKNADLRLARYKEFFHRTCGGEINSSSSAWMVVSFSGLRDPWSAVRKLAAAQVSQRINRQPTGARLRVMELLNLLSPLPPRGAVPWFHADGFLLLCSELWKEVPGSGCLADALFTEDEQVQIMLRGVLPLAVHEQQAVRQSASALLVLQSRGTLGKTIPSVVSAWLSRECARCTDDGSPVPLVEGMLQLSLSFPYLQRQLLDMQLGCGLPFAAHSAASVRQAFADVLAASSPPSTTTLLGIVEQSIDEYLGASSSEALWKRLETLLMSLLAKLVPFCRSTEMSAEDDDDGSMGRLFEKLVSLSCATRFEVRRMAQQVLPPFVQFYVRTFSAAHVVRCLCSPELRSLAPQFSWYLVLKRFIALHTPLGQRYVGDIDRALDAQAQKVRMLDAASKITLGASLEAWRDLAATDAWESVLLDADASLRDVAVRFAIDCALFGRQCSRIVELWCRAASQLPAAYVLLNLLEAISVACSETPRTALPFAYLRREELRAPCLTDGGDHAVLGCVWFHAAVSSPQSVPTARWSGLRQDSVGGDDWQTVSTRVLRPLFTDVVVSDTIEPRALDFLFLIAEKATSVDHAFLRVVVEGMTKRLTARYEDSWQQRACASAESSPSNVKQAAANSFDCDSDDDDDAGGVRALDARSEVARFGAFLKTVGAGVGAVQVRAELARVGCSAEVAGHLVGQ